MSPGLPDSTPDRGRPRSPLAAFFHERLGLDDLWALAVKKRVPIHRTTAFYFLGGMALFLFAIQVVTGILLSLYYKPSPDQAFESVRAIMTEIEYGWLIRSVHSWSANLLIGVLFLHLLTAYSMRAYRRPREFTWITGFLLLVLFMAFGFSGYLLPWNQLAFFATKVGTAIMGEVPLVGNELLRLARSGDSVTGDTLARFYSLHVVILPLAVLGLLGVHLYLVQKHGMSVPGRTVKKYGTAEGVPSMPFFPHFLLRDMVGWYVALGLLAALAALFPWELGEKLTNPFAETPAGTKPEWYFLFMFVTLEQLPGKILGIDGAALVVMFFGLCGMIVLLVPFLDWGADRERPRRILNFLATWAVFAFVFQTAVGLGVFFESEVKDPAQATGILGLAVLASGLVAVVFWTLAFAANRWLGILGILLLAGILGAVSATAAQPQAKVPEKRAASSPRKAEKKPSQAAVPKKGPATIPDEKNTCIACHGSPDWAETLEPAQKHLIVSPKYVGGDIHWQKGLRCQDCHGGDATADDFGPAHAGNGGLRSIKPADLPEFCGNCHANIDYMRRYVPSPRVDQLREYWTSGHGQRLKATGDPNVATCISCHDQPHGSGPSPTKHGIREVADLQSPVYRTNVAKTCAKCHSDEKLMAGRQYHGRPIGHDQYDAWRKSIHAKALLDKGDLSAPTCNNCHGNHGAVPPQVDSVANACGTCHGKVASLFAQARMKHRFEEVGLPGCATCHGNHDIGHPSDEMLGMTSGAVCLRCHEKGKYGATLAGAEAARAMRAGLDGLKEEIAEAQEKIAEADRLGMEVRGPRFDLRKAADSLTAARVTIHSFSVPPVEATLKEGVRVADEVLERANAALAEHTSRRVWLALSLVPIVLVIVLLLAYIRSMPVGGRDRPPS